MGWPRTATCGIFFLHGSACRRGTSTLKCELVHRRRFPTRQAARSAIFEYLEGFYNRRRLHSSLGYVSPKSYEHLMTKEVAVA